MRAVKPFKQKGTGNLHVRAPSAPHMTGGLRVVHGPTPRKLRTAHPQEDDCRRIRGALPTAVTTRVHVVETSSPVKPLNQR